jgi:hypothetical protein
MVGFDIDSDGHMLPWSNSDSRWSDYGSGSPPRDPYVGTLTWMTAARTWAHQASGPTLTATRERHESRRAQELGEREYTELGNWEIGNDPEVEVNPEKLSEFLNVPGTVTIVTVADEACAGFEPTYPSHTGVHHSTYVVIAGFQSDSFFDGAATSDVTGPVTETLHGREGYAILTQRRWTH